MRTTIRITAVLALAMFIGHAAVAADPAKADPVKIGVVNEITGVQAQAGEFTVNGIKLAQEEINNAGGILGRRIELQIEDNQSTMSSTRTATACTATTSSRTKAAGSYSSNAWTSRCSNRAICHRETQMRNALTAKDAKDAKGNQNTGMQIQRRLAVTFDAADYAISGTRGSQCDGY